MIGAARRVQGPLQSLVTTPSGAPHQKQNPPPDRTQTLRASGCGTYCARRICKRAGWAVGIDMAPSRSRDTPRSVPSRHTTEQKGTRCACVDGGSKTKTRKTTRKTKARKTRRTTQKDRGAARPLGTDQRSNARGSKKKTHPRRRPLPMHALIGTSPRLACAMPVRAAPFASATLWHPVFSCICVRGGASTVAPRDRRPRTLRTPDAPRRRWTSGAAVPEAWPSAQCSARSAPRASLHCGTAGRVAGASSARTRTPWQTGDVTEYVQEGYLRCVAVSSDMDVDVTAKRGVSDIAWRAAARP